jgi:agmatinase
VDLFDLDVMKPYEPGIFMREESKEVLAWNETAKRKASRIVEVGGNLGGRADLEADLAEVNRLSGELNRYVYEQTRSILAAEKLPAVLGGDHSVPFGAFQAIGEKYPRYGILHFDAHSDTRDAYEGFQWSHASIMRNALDHVPAITKLVQVGIRDVCEEEMDYTSARKTRVTTFLDRDIARRQIEGSNFATIAQEIVAALPREVWISFDIDGLDPRFCPHTGTPVAKWRPT